MTEISLGRVIRQARIDSGLSQEQLARGICSVATLSRYENDDRVPSKKTYDLLMSRLGVPGFLYEKINNPCDYDLLQLQYDILHEMYIGFITCQDREIIHEKMYGFVKLAESDSQYLKFELLIKAHWIYMNNSNSTDLKRLQIAEVILNLCREGFEKDCDVDLENCGGDYFFQNGLDIVELMLLNLMAIGEYMRGEYARALELELGIYNYIKNTWNKDYKREPHLAYVCNNIAVFLIEIGLYSEALIYAKRAVKKGIISNCMVATCYFMATRKRCYEKLKDTDSAKAEQNLINLMVKEIKNSAGIKLEDVYSAKPLQIF